MRYYIMFVLGMVCDMALAGFLSWLFNLNFLLTFLLLSELVRRISSILALKRVEEEGSKLLKHLKSITKE